VHRSDTVEQKLSECTTKNTPRFGMRGIRLCKVIKVIDGDTIVLAFFYNEKDENPCRLSCRMYGYDTPEISHSTEEERIEGQRCKDAISTMLQDKV
jgi:endonuclease YncB( thermonuclease family)